MRLSANPFPPARSPPGAHWGTNRELSSLGGLHTGVMRAADHQFQQPLVVSVMDRSGHAGVRHDVERSGYGFRTVRRFKAGQVEMPHHCQMDRPD